MHDSRWQQIKALFAKAAELPSAERAGFLRRECGADDELLREVESLLRSHPAAPPADPLRRDAALEPGSRIGPYKLLEQIGEGGFGFVFMAQQEAPLRRRVALKVLKPGMDSRQVVARFEQERQALAMMDHPNIAKVFDGGAADSGQPYFVMELVRGDPITTYCDRERLDTRERLDLFAQVCRAVQHAHQKGVIHRDLKPNNVLVTIVDGKPVPKVIDFGVAKATQSQLTTATLFTEHRQMLGTPLYMSPEQAALSGVDVDTRSDVYSLGVLLYELLTGSTPFDRAQLLQAGILEIQRVIKEVEPQKPSTRAATLARTNAAIAAQRRVDASRLGLLLRGDLDWIAMKCLEKERARRYDTALELAQDVERHLAGEPVLAAPPSTLYRLRKLVRRRRGIVAAAIAVGAVGAVGLMAWLGEAQHRANEAVAFGEREHGFRVAAQESDRSAAAARKEAEFGDYCAKIEAAAAALQQEDVARARELLDACMPALRNWEWRHLDAACDRSLWVGRAHEGTVTCVAFTPDGTRIVSGGTDHRVCIWDTRTGTLVRQWSAHDAGVQIVAVSADGKRMLSKAGQGQLCVWELDSGRLLLSLTDLTGNDGFARFCGPGDDGIVAQARDGVGCWDAKTGEQRWRVGDGSKIDLAAVSPDLSHIVTTSGTTLRIWDRNAAGAFREYQEHTKIIRTVVFHPDGSLFLTTSEDGSLRQWTAADGKSREWLRPEGGAFPLSAAYSCDGGTLAAACSDRTAQVGGTVDWIVLPGHDNAVDSVLFNPDGTLVLTLTWLTGPPRLWRLGFADAVALPVLRGHVDAVHAAAFSPNGTRIVTGSADGTVRLWSIDTDVERVRVSRVGTSDHETSKVRFAANGERFATFEDPAYGHVFGLSTTLWDAVTLTPIARFRLPNRFADVALDDQARYFAIAEGPEPVVRMHNAEDGTHLPPDCVGPSDARITTCRVVADGRHLVAKCEDDSVLVWELPSRTLLRRLRPEGVVKRSCLSPRGTRLAVLLDNNEVHVLDLLGQQAPQTLGKCQDIWDFSADESRLLTTARADPAPTILQIWNLAQSSLIATLDLEADVANHSVLIDTSGTRVLTRGKDGVRLWDVDSHRCLGVWRGDWAARFSADGTRIVAADGLRIMLIDARSGRRVLAWKQGVGSDQPACSPDGSVIAVTSSEDRDAWVWTTVPFRLRAQAIENLAAAKARIRPRLEALAGGSKPLSEIRRSLTEQGLADVWERRAGNLLLAELEDQRLDALAGLKELRFGATAAAAQAAITNLELVLADFPQEVALRRLLGMLLHRAGRHADSIAILTDTTAREHLEANFRLSQWALLSMAHARLGDRAAAAAALERFRALAGDDPDSDGKRLLAEAEATFAEAFPR